jgi:hypothetical protein
MSEDIKYGCINEDEFSLQGPRMIDGNECNTIERAFAQAVEMLQDGTEKISICKCKYYGEDGNGYWGEIFGDGFGQISIDASYVEWLVEDEEEVD